MFRKFSVLVLAGFALGLGGCAHSHKVQGHEAKSEIPEGFRVAIGSKEVKDGDRVRVFRSVCKQVTILRGASVNKCKDEKVGEALVLKVLDHDAAIVQPDEGVVMDTSMQVEKL